MLSSPSSSPSSVNSPSFGRRRVLKEMDDANGNRLNVIDGYPLSQYIEMGEEYHKRFENAFHNSDLDEAYIYGMRYTELVILDLPNHHAWNTRKNTTEQRKKMRSQASKILSRLNIIKRRMDVEESKKLRTSLAQADDEIRMQNIFNPAIPQREREERQPVGNIENGGGQNFLQSQGEGIIAPMAEIIVVVPLKQHQQQHSNVGLGKQKSMTKKARRKIRQFLGIPKNSLRGITSTVKKNNSTAENSSLSSDTVSNISTEDLMVGPVVPSLDTIRNSRQHELLQPSQLY